MKVSFLELVFDEKLQSSINESILRISNSSNYIGGKEIEFFEKEYAKFLNLKEAIAVGNGYDALVLSLKVLGISSGDEVLVPSNTFIATWLAIVSIGAKPIPVEPIERTYNIDYTKIEKLISKKTKAIISVSVYGLPPNYDQILKICRDNKLFLIEDNAECFLGKYNKKKIGCFGDFSAVSFQASKHMTCGNGGMLCCNSIELADKARKISNLGYTTVGAKKMLIKKEEIQSPNFKRHSILGYNLSLIHI